MPGTTQATQVYRVYIKATPRAVWDAITKPEWTERYGFRTPVEYDLRPGGAYRALANEQMQEVGVPEVMFEGEVLEADAPHRLVHTQRAMWEPEDGLTRITYEIAEGEAGVTALTVTHELDDAPNLAAMVAGEVEGAGGWNQLLSDLKTLLETGEPLYA